MFPYTESDFLHRVLAEPGNRAAHLIYADWLEEQGDVRAELIRLEEEMADLPVYSDRYVALKPRRATLRDQVDPTWRETLGYVPKHRPMFAKLPETRVERWRLFEEFSDIWQLRTAYRGVLENDLAEFEARKGCRLPAALREWYLLAGHPLGERAPSAGLAPLSIDLPIESTCLVPFYVDRNGLPLFEYRIGDSNDPPVHGLNRLQEVVSPIITGFAIRNLFLSACTEPRGPDHVLFLAHYASVDIREIEKQFSFALAFNFAGYGCEEYYESEDLLLSTFEPLVRGVARSRKAFGRLSKPLRDVLRERS